MLKGLEFTEIENVKKTVAEEMLGMGSGKYKVEMKCNSDDIEGVKFIVAGYNVISEFVGDLLDKISSISSVIAHSNSLKEKEIEEMKEEHKDRMFRDDRPREQDLIDIDGVEYVVVRRKFKNGKITYVLKDKNLNIIEHTV